MKNYLKIAMIPAIASIACIASCKKTSNDSQKSTSTSTSTKPSTSTALKFTLDSKEIQDGANLEIAVGESLKVISVSGTGSSTATFTSSAADVLEVGATTGKLNAKKLGNATITVAVSGKEYKFNFTVVNPTKQAGVYSYADASYDEKAKILGTLEKYAVDNYLTGITLFSDGGRVVYNSRYTPKPSKYVVGYGWGTEREGELTGTLPDALGGKSDYYQIGTTLVTNRADAMNATGSDVSTLSGYITSAYFGTRLKETNDGYEWYPILATCNEPIALEENGTDDNGYTQVKVANDATQSDRWRIYVRTGQNGSYKTNAPKYKTASKISAFQKYDGKYVEAEDYLTPFKWMLTSANGQVRGAELLDGVSGFAGASDYYAASSDKSALGDKIYNESAWDEYMVKGHNIVMGSDDNGTYIDFKLTVPCTQFYAKYYLSSSLYSPMPAEILKEYPKYGTEPSASERLDQTTISCGAYYISERPGVNSLTVSRNENFIGQIYDKDSSDNAIEKLSDDSQPRKIYNIAGFQWSQIEDSARESNFLGGKVDSYSPTKDTLSKYINGSGIDEGGVSWHSYQTEAESTFKINVNSLNSTEWKKLFGTSGTIYAHSAAETNKYTDQRDVRSYMTDKNFLDFLSFGLDRKTVAESRGKTPTQDYFANAYICDPEEGTVYNNTDYHKAALADRHYDTYGYDATDAADALTECIRKTIAPNKDKLPKNSNGKTQVIVTMNWMNTTDVKDYGDVFDSITTIFKDVVSKKFGNAYELVIDQQNGTSDYNAVYDKMKHGEFDLGFGAISGNTMSPLNFLEVLKSDNSSGFTLNWGTDTSEVSNDIVYDGKVWSFDSLWNAGNTVAVLNSEAKVATPTASDYDMTTWASDSAKESVSYTIAFDDLIAAGAIINSVYGSTDGFGNGKTLYTREEATTKIDENHKSLRITLDSTFNNTGIKGVTDEKDSNRFKENVEATVTLTVGYSITVGGTSRSLTSTVTVANYYSVKATLESK